jgi:hypothetical protein
MTNKLPFPPPPPMLKERDSIKKTKFAKKK